MVRFFLFVCFVVLTVMCEFLIPFSHHFHASICLSSGVPPASASLLLAFVSCCICPSVCSSLCWPAFICDSVCLLSVCGFRAYAVSPSVCQCFSSCQTFSLSVSPFCPFFSLSSWSSPMRAYRTRACVGFLGRACMGMRSCRRPVGSPQGARGSVCAMH